MPGHGAMHSEYYRLPFRRQVHSAHGAPHSLDAQMGPVNHVGHDWLISGKGAHGTADAPLRGRRRSEAASASAASFSATLDAHQLRTDGRSG
jgi:hypothetical protein